MYVLIIVLNKLDYLDEILAKFIDLEVGGATILDSQGMAGAMVDANNRVPIFGFLKSVLDDCKPYNKTVFTVLESEELVEKVVAMVKETLGEDAKQGAGLMFTVLLGKVYRFQE